MRAFLGMLYFTAVHWLPEINNHFSSKWVLQVQNFAHVFTMAKWWQLWSNLHLADNKAPDHLRAGMPGHDNIWKIRPRFDLQQKEFQEKYYTGQNVSVDEMMVKGEESSEAIFAHKIHQEKQQGVGTWLFLLWLRVWYASLLEHHANTMEQGLAFHVVTDLCEQHLPNENNHAVPVDNFFNSLPLTQHLGFTVLGQSTTRRRNTHYSWGILSL